MQTLVEFISTSRNVLFAGILISILDFLFVMNPKIKANGIIHSIYLFFKDIAVKKKERVSLESVLEFPQVVQLVKLLRVTPPEQHEKIMKKISEVSAAAMPPTLQ